jgi:predicted glutamine amidotransferase
MCGLISVIRKDWTETLGITYEVIFKEMLYCDTLRGNDGTGVFTVDKDFKLTAEKEPKAAPYCWKELKPTLDGIYKSIIAVGHNRKSTIGVNTKTNTHPFMEGSVTLVHNGTLTNKSDLGNADVDSNCIAQYMSKHKPIDALEKLEGAYALIWWDSKEKQLLFARNKERPLWIVETEKAYLLVSEPGLAEWITERNGIKTSKTTEVKVGLLYRLMINKHKKLQLVYHSFKPAETKQIYSVPYTKYSSPKQNPLVKTGDVVRVIFTKKTAHGYSHGNHNAKNVKLTGYILDNVSVDVYTWVTDMEAKEYTGYKAISGTIGSVYGDECYIRDLQIVKEENEIISANDSRFTAEEIKEMESTVCCKTCKKKLVAIDVEESLLYKKEKTALLNPADPDSSLYTYGFVYEYYCPTCTWDKYEPSTSMSSYYG